MKTQTKDSHRKNSPYCAKCGGKCTFNSDGNENNNKIVYTDNSGITYTREAVEAAGGIAEIVRLSAGSYDR